MDNNDTQVKAIITKLHAELGSDEEVSVVTQLSKSQVQKLRSGTAAGTGRMLARLKRALTGTPTPPPKSFIDEQHPQLERVR